MAVLRVVVLWHQHQPFYKDLVTGEYRMPWVRMHGLKDYYGMVKLLDEFPQVHQTFNLVPSLIAQLQDYVSGTAKDPFLEVAAKPGRDLTSEERQFALRHLFQANVVHMIGRYPRFRELWERYQSAGESPERAEKYFQIQDFTDLQVLSQIAWFDEFFLEDPVISELVRKGHEYSLDDQRFVIAYERELLARVLPAHAEAAQKGGIEISTSAFYHPILPLLCDSNAGAASTPGLPLPQNRFRRPEDAREQLLRGLDLHQQVFGIRPRGVWPSEGSVSEEVLGVAQELGVKWMATDEEVLARSLGVGFARDSAGRMELPLAEKLYTIHRFERTSTQMYMLFRDHTISDLIGFVYSGMAPAEAANHLIQNIKRAAEPLISAGKDAVVPIILDGENAWEYYPKSGRDFLRWFCDGLQQDPSLEAVTVSEAIERHKPAATLSSLTPGSWINANFNVWIGAPEDNKSWDYLYHARNFYEQATPQATEAQQKLAFEELLIAEGSDWNWWYGPEHSSANDAAFDELYRKHLSNVYHALGARPPNYLGQPITAIQIKASFIPQTAYIHPRITGELVRYFEWMGAAVYTAARASAMHGKTFLLDAMHSGIDESCLYGRLDFKAGVPQSDFELLGTMECWGAGESVPRRTLRLEIRVQAGELQGWKVTGEGESLLGSSLRPSEEAAVVLGKNLEFRVPLEWLSGANSGGAARPALRLRLNFGLWQNQLPVDSIPAEGWVELSVVSEDALASGVS